MSDYDLTVSDTEIACLSLPLLDKNLLVPTVTVAEMAPIQPFDILANTPDWFLGYYPWRDLRVPIVAYETLNHVSAPKLGARSRVAILHNAGVSDKLLFIGILTQDIPRMVKVEEPNIIQDTEAESSAYDLMAVNVEAETFYMPNLAAIEEAILSLNLVR